MDEVERTFDGWAVNGRAERMEREHSPSVTRFLRSARLPGRFSFLDVGCGNGWVVRRMASRPGCRRAVGIDKSGRMVSEARRLSAGTGARFHHTGLESFTGRGFDCVFSMESLYYARSVPAALARIYGMLKPGGRLFCGTDFYAENRATAKWARMLGIRMHLLPEEGWLSMFEEAGFRASSRHVTDPDDRRKWRRELGTLFITGTRPARKAKIRARS
ncbi:MAG: class I SAM-dependent methyltransferase [Nitrosopumilus sp.]|nr:class I SAM-dependent methyltransferase [Nitrosopumilus sp.]CAI9831227.1 SAM dependent methyltransferase [Nitrosopumilaceae archaeon]MDA7940744.1 class I SAM-dependent methyltransferase [Nitrosopumilus sp.]MDA7942952.1 class I SAM-dependent methyltransferase [Nitrosopumilus sp.]MDA7944637.1 class I SAM-dependent methyltransferase [Nitrosopumilus sp.]